MSAYILCASPRSGSTLLCDLLWQTRVAGKPNSFFRPWSIANFAEHFGLPAMDRDTYDQSYIDAALAEGTHETGTFGLRLMWDSLHGLLDRLRHLQGDGSDTAILNRAFGRCRFIHLHREDKLSQAISLTIAEQTGLWHRNADGSDRENFHLADVATYDAPQITKEIGVLNNEVARWNTWFSANNVSPHRLTYERLAANPTGELAKVLSFLDLDPAIASRAVPGTQKIANAVNRDWNERYRRDHGLPPATTPV